MKPNAIQVRIVIPAPETEWILGKIALKLQQHASAEDIEISIGPHVVEGADVNHYLPWWAAHGRLVSRSLLMVTHIEPDGKWEERARELCPAAAHVTTMSAQTKERLRGWGIPSERITVAHIGVDQDWKPRPIIVGLAYRVYRDGRKREKMLLRLADRMDLSAFCFIIIGTGWEGVVEGLEERGVNVSYYPTNDYQSHKTLVPQLDYWLYTGAWDEGPMGMLDALRCGVQCILPPHGYCLEAAPLAYFYNSFEELQEVFLAIKNLRWQHREAIEEWTWENYGQLHAELYRGVADGWGDY